MELYLKESLGKKLQKISKKGFPSEACAFLIGNIEKEKASVEEIREVENILNSSSSFLIEPKTLVEVLDEFENSECEIVGFFHSHPDLSSFVSSRDKKFMKLWPQKIWMIAGTDQKGEITEIKAYIWENEAPEEIEIRSENFET